MRNRVDNEGFCSRALVSISACQTCAGQAEFAGHADWEGCKSVGCEDICLRIIKRPPYGNRAADRVSFSRAYVEARGVNGSLSGTVNIRNTIGKAERLS